MTVRTQIFSWQRNGKDSFVWNKIDKEKRRKKRKEKKTRVYLYEHVHLHVSEISLFVRSIQMLPLRVQHHKPKLQHTTKHRYANQGSIPWMAQHITKVLPLNFRQQGIDRNETIEVKQLYIIVLTRSQTLKEDYQIIYTQTIFDTSSIINIAE